MAYPPLSELVAILLADAPLAFKVSARGRLSISGKTTPPEGTFAASMAQMPAASVPKLAPWLGLLRDPQGCHALAEALIKALASVEPEAPPADMSQPLCPEVSHPLHTLSVVYDMADSERGYLYHGRTDTLYRYDFQALSRLVKTRHGEEAWKAMLATARHCVFEYRPNAPRFFPATKPDDFERLNSWTAAEWATPEWRPPETKPEAPGEYAAFMAHLFPDPSHRAFAEGWLRDATFERAQSVLALVGVPGTGKNIFVEALAAGLVGKHNYRPAPRKFSERPFQAAVSGCRLFFFDEQILNADLRETLKAFHNDVATVERKNIEVGEPERIHASLVLANNHKSKVRLEYTDRKFFVPGLSEVPLLKVWNPARVAALVELFSAPEYLRGIADYLWYHYPPGASGSPPKTEDFRRSCLYGYEPWQRALFDLLTVQHRVGPRDVAGKGAKTHREVEEALDHYRAQFGEEIGTLEPGSIGRHWTVISTKIGDTDL